MKNLKLFSLIGLLGGIAVAFFMNGCAGSSSSSEATFTVHTSTSAN